VPIVDWLKETRESKGYTQESLAEILEIPKTTYSSYEQGHRRPSVKRAKEIAVVLGFDWTIFFEDEVRVSS